MARSPGLHAVQGDAARLPIRDGCVDLICFAQSWHWVDGRLRAAEAHRVLHRSGRWAAWWSHARADGEDWFNSYWTAIETTCQGTNRSQRDTDWGKDLAQTGLFIVNEPIAVAWTRRVGVDLWLTEHRSHSNFASLDEADREGLLDQLTAILNDRFPGGTVEVAYETRLWRAHPVK
jgi:methyltransferase family protein